MYIGINRRDILHLCRQPPPFRPLKRPPLPLLLLAVVAGARDRRLEGVGPVAVYAPDDGVHRLRLHHVAALSDGGDRLGGARPRPRGHRPALAEAAAGVGRHVELDAARYAYLPCVAWGRRELRDRRRREKMKEEGKGGRGEWGRMR